MVASEQCPSCGLVVDESTHVCQKGANVTESFPQIDEQFKTKYQVLETVGAGGMGVIYKARHNILNRIVAVKMVHAHIVSPEVIKRFYHEGKASSSLSHPYIVKVLDFGTTESGQPYMILDFVHGKTLSNVLATEGSLSTERFIRLFLQICEALSYAHKNWILHRDIKPANIMLVENSRGEEEIRIMDFGLAKIIDDTEYAAQHLTKTGVAMGSPLYMSPEHARGSNMDERSDLYSLGCTMYEALTGTPPFVGKTPFETLLMHLNDKPLPLKEASLGKIIDPRLEIVVLKLLEKNLNDRYQSMEELREDLLNIQNQPTDNLPNTDKRKTSSGKVKALIVAGTAAGLCGLTAAGYYYLHNNHQQPKPQLNPSASVPGSALLSAKPSSAPASHTSSDTQDANDNHKIATPGSELDHPEGTVKIWQGLTGKTLVQGLVNSHQPTIDATKYRDEITADTDLEPLQEAEWSNNIILKEVPITDAALTYLSKLKLTSLNLTATKVKDLGPLKNMKSLVELSVPSTPLTSKGMQVIGGLSNLVTLNLTATKIRDNDLVPLTKLTKLKFLELSGCENLTPKAVDQLTVELEPCQVTFWQYAVADHKPFTETMEAMRLLHAGDYRHSYAKFRKASTMLANSSDQALKARCLSGAADCKSGIGEYPEAARFYDQALAMLEKRPTEDVNTVEVLNGAARTHELANDFAQATVLRSKLEETYKRCQNLNYSPSRLQSARALNLLCQSYGTATLDQPEKAAKQFKLALSLLPEKEQNSNKVARAAERVGTSYVHEKKHADAIPFFERTYKFYLSQGSKFHQPRVLLQQQLAESYNSVGRYKEAENILRNIIDLPADRVLKDRRYACMIDILKKEKKMSEADRLELKRKSMPL